MTIPPTDPGAIFLHYRSNFASELLIAAVAHIPVFAALAKGPLSQTDLGAAVALAPRPTAVLVTALRAMGMLVLAGGRLALTEQARNHLAPGAAWSIADYLGLSANEPGVLEMVARLRTDRPAGSDADQGGAAFIFKAGTASAMEAEASARRFTLGLAGRARCVAPAVALRAGLEQAEVLLDVGGGTGLYALACLERYPHLRAIVWDRPEVLKVAREMAAASPAGDRLELRPGDMFTDEVPHADVMLLSNILHDWDFPECNELVGRLAPALPKGGRLLVHDVFLDDDLGGPLPIALYSARLFTVCAGRAYSGAEYRAMLRQAGLTPGDTMAPTLADCGIITGTK
jgi:hypothetical protein